MMAQVEDSSAVAGSQVRHEVATLRRASVSRRVGELMLVGLTTGAGARRRGGCRACEADVPVRPVRSYIFHSCHGQHRDVRVGGNQFLDRWL